jgi:hypothetical protein
MLQHREDRRFKCAGCLRTFVKRGLLSHLEQSTDPHCMAVRKTMFEDLPGVYKGPDHNMAVDEDVNMELQAFEGDFFGAEYGTDEFPGFEEAQNSDEEDNSGEIESDEDSDEDL